MHKVDFIGSITECYGTLQEDSNLQIVCEDEAYDTVWCDGDPTGGSFDSWEDVVSKLQPLFPSTIIEISAV